MTTAPAGLIPEWTLGWRLQRALAHSGMSVSEMCDTLGVSRSTLSRWMHDQGQPPKAAFVKQWALATGVPLDWLLTAETQNTPGPDGPGSAVTERYRNPARISRRSPFTGASPDALISPGLAA